MSTKRCPYCAEEIAANAAVCKHCGRDVRQGRNRLMFILFVIACLIVIALIANYVISNAQRGIF